MQHARERWMRRNELPGRGDSIGAVQVRLSSAMYRCPGSADEGEYDGRRHAENSDCDDSHILSDFRMV